VERAAELVSAFQAAVDRDTLERGDQLKLQDREDELYQGEHNL